LLFIGKNEEAIGKTERENGPSRVGDQDRAGTGTISLESSSNFKARQRKNYIST
jgi:hypothetical protein